jgi:hypothetical protein
MNLPNFSGGVGGAMISFLSTPPGEEAIRQYFCSSEGSEFLKHFAASPEGRKIIRCALPHVLEGMELPPGTRDMIRKAMFG